MKHYTTRQNAIRELIRSNPIRTQRELVALLRERGFSCTQATVSRATAEMCLRKLSEGTYVLSEDMHLQHMLSEFVISVTAAGNLVVVRCHPGTASAVAFAVDEVKLNFCVGTIAGADTVFLAIDEPAHAQQVCEVIEQLGSIDV